MMLRATGKKLILRPALPHTMSDGGIHLVNTSNDACADRIYHVVSFGPQVTIQGLRWGTRVLISGYVGVGFDFEGYPLRVVTEDEVLMVLPEDDKPPTSDLPTPEQASSPLRLAPGTVAIGHPTVDYPSPEQPS